MAKKQLHIFIVPGGNDSRWHQLPADATVRFRTMQGWQAKLFLAPDPFTAAFKIGFSETNYQGSSTIVSQLITRLQQAGAVYMQNNQLTVCQTCGQPGLPEHTCNRCGGDIIMAEREGYYFRIQQYKEQVMMFFKQEGIVLPVWHREQVIEAFAGLQEEKDLLIAQKVSRVEKEFYSADWLKVLGSMVTHLGFTGVEGGPPKQLQSASIYCPWERMEYAYYWCAAFAALGFPWPGSFVYHSYYRLLDRQDKEVSLNLLAQNYGQESIRYMLLATPTTKRENVFSEEQVVQRINHDLTNELGNLITKVASLVSQYAGELTPQPDILTRQNEDLILRETALAAPAKMDQCFTNQDLAGAVGVVKDVIRALADFAATETGKIKAGTVSPQRLNTVLYNLCEGLRFGAVLFKPIMPEAANSILVLLGLEELPELGAMKSLEQWGALPVGTKITAQPMLFPRIISGKSSVSPWQNLVLREELARIKMVAARILSAETVPGYEGLLRLVLFDGNRRYSVLAPLARSYEPGAIEGKKVVLVSNIKPSETVASEGEMLMVEAEAGEKRPVFLAESVLEGSKVSCLN